MLAPLNKRLRRMRVMRTKAKAMKPSHKQENETKHLLEEIKESFNQV